jgi:hypothetical protein
MNTYVEQRTIPLRNRETYNAAVVFVNLKVMNPNAALFDDQVRNFNCSPSCIRAASHDQVNVVPFAVTIRRPIQRDVVVVPLNNFPYRIE